MVSISLAFRSLAFVAAVLSLLSCSKPQNPATGAARSAMQTVDIDGTSFRPATLTVQFRTAFVWMSTDTRF